LLHVSLYCKECCILRQHSAYSNTNGRWGNTKGKSVYITKESWHVWEVRGSRALTFPSYIFQNFPTLLFSVHSMNTVPHAVQCGIFTMGCKEFSRIVYIQFGGLAKEVCVQIILFYTKALLTICKIKNVFQCDTTYIITDYICWYYNLWLIKSRNWVPQ
jgi:hypothetical protein